MEETKTARPHDNRIAEIRDGMGFKAKHVAKLLDLHPAHYSKIERGVLPLTIDQAKFLTELFRCSHKDLYVGRTKNGG